MAEAVLGLGHAHRKVAVAPGRESVQLLLCRSRNGDRLRAVQALCDALDLLHHGRIGHEERRERSPGSHVVLNGSNNRLRKRGSTFSTTRVNFGQTHVVCTAGSSGIGQGIEFRIGVAREAVDGDHDRHAESGHVADVAVEVGLRALKHGLDVFCLQLFLARATSGPVSESPAMEFHGANGDVHHDTIRRFLPHRGLDVHEFLSAHVGSEPCFGHHVVGAGQGQAIADDR